MKLNSSSAVKNPCFITPLYSLLTCFGRRILFVTQAILILFLTSIYAQNLQAAEPTKNVLILYSYDADLPWQRNVRLGLRERAAQLHIDEKFQLFEENLDAIRLRPGPGEATWVNYLRDKYHAIKLDMVISESVPAGKFLYHHRDLFPKAKYYLVQPGASMVSKDYDSVVEFQEDLHSCMKVSLDLWPKSKRLVVIGNHNPAAVVRAQMIWKEYFSQTVSYEAWTDDFSLNELYQRAANLPDDAVILYLLVNHDRTGTRIYPYKVLNRLAENSSVPVFSCHDVLMGWGTVGGYLLSAKRVGRAMADIMDGAKPRQFSADFFLTYEFDARQLNRWGISQKALPAGSIVLYQENTFWQKYQVELIAFILFMIGEIALIIALIRALRAKQKTQVFLEERVEERTTELKTANEQLAVLSLRDELTQLANRRQFNQVLEKEFLRHRRSEKPLSLIMLDVDYFKDYNDYYGHVAGDVCLQELAKVIASCVKRPTDLAARFGGEEFSILMAETDVEGASKVAEAIQTGIAELKLPHANSHVSNYVTVSIGVVTVSVSNLDSPTGLVNLADVLLYKAKFSGRNRIVTRDLFHDSSE